MAPRLYGELASWWPLVSSPADYAGEAALYARIMEEFAEGEVRDVLELGSGGGNNASHLRSRFMLTLVDRAPPMLEVSLRLNPGCEHLEGDMRTVRLGRTFDAVLLHDAVMYMTSEGDLRAAVRSAAAHLREGGVAVFVPDDTTETFEPTTSHGGHDGEGRSLRYLEWTHPARGSTFLVSFVFLLREGEGPVRTEYDEHVFGLFPRATWMRLLEEEGLEPGLLRHSYGNEEGRDSNDLFVARKPRSG